MRRRVDLTQFAERFAVWLGVGVGIAALVACAFAYLMVRPSPALGAETYRVPAACIPLAQRYSIAEVLTRGEALQAKLELERRAWWPGVKICLKAVNREWKL